MADTAVYAERAATAASEAHHTTLVRGANSTVGVALAEGPIPADEVLARLEQMRAAGGLWLPILRGPPLAQLGRIEEARRELAAGRAAAEELGLPATIDFCRIFEGWAEVASGNLDAAERQLRAVVTNLAAEGSSSTFSTYGGELAVVLARLGQTDEAADLAARAHEVTAAGDISAMAMWRMAMALVTAARGDPAAGEQLAREAVETLRPTDMLDRRGDAHRTLADVLDAASRHEEATAERREALRLYEAKKVLPKVAELRAQLASEPEIGSNRKATPRSRNRSARRS